MLLVAQLQWDLVDQTKRIIWGVNKGVTLEGEHQVERWYRSEVKKLVKKLGEEKYQPYQDAKIDSETGEIHSENVGREVLIEATVTDVMNAPADTNVDLKFFPVYPQITTDFLESIENQVGSYITWIGGGGNGGRVTNIEIATRDINNTLLFPGQVFSFNQGTLPRTWERGYRFAPVIVGDSVIDGIGGGICQVSSTLYNAALNADMEIIERHPHGRPVDYVPPGRDATIAGDYLDLKFRNNTDKVLLIIGSVHGGQIKVDILASNMPLALQKK